MQGNITTAMLGGLFLVMAMAIPVWARSGADEARLETIKKDIDQSPVSLAQSEKVQTLSRQFNVDSGVVENLRANKQGWGETTIELAMAQRLMQTDTKTYPTMTEALNKIASLRSQKMGWGSIAGNLGFKLGPVVSAAMHTRNELRKESRAPASLSAQKPDRSGKIEKPGRPENAGRPDRPARHERAVRDH